MEGEKQIKEDKRECLWWDISHFVRRAHFENPQMRRLCSRPLPVLCTTDEWNKCVKLCWEPLVQQNVDTVSVSWHYPPGHTSALTTFHSHHILGSFLPYAGGNVAEMIPSFKLAFTLFWSS